MKIAWLLFGSVLAVLLAYGVWRSKNIHDEEIASDSPQHYAAQSSNGGYLEKPVILHKSEIDTSAYYGYLPKSILPDSIVAYGTKLIGAPYLPAGITCNGFDCSGFVYFIFNKYGIKLPHSSALLANAGADVPLNQARKGDLLIFTGTTESNRTPGHVGVVITEPGEAVKFVHASSEGGVKISQVSGTGYERRFLRVKRVL